MNKRPAATPACCPPDLATPETLQANDPQADARLATFAKALGHPARIRIIRLLASRDTSMCSHLVDELPLAQSTVSEHLRVLGPPG